MGPSSHLRKPSDSEFESYGAACMCRSCDEVREWFGWDEAPTAEEVAEAAAATQRLLASLLK